MQNDGEDFEELNFKAESKHWFEKFLIYFYWLYYFFASYAQVSLNGLTSQYQKRGKK